MELDNEIKALKWAAEIIKTSCASREGDAGCEACPFRECCLATPEKWDLDSIGRGAGG